MAAKKPNTITRDELARLAFCNSAKLPKKVNMAGRLKEWVGIGWIDLGPAQDGVITLVDEERKRA